MSTDSVWQEGLKQSFSLHMKYKRIYVCTFKSNSILLDGIDGLIRNRRLAVLDNRCHTNLLPLNGNLYNDHQRIRKG